jgi:SET domain-containing protein
VSAAGTEARASAISGQGLFARRDFAVGELIAAYAGTLLTAPPDVPTPGQPTYLVEIRPGVWLDGSAPDNPARFANHSCAPNAELVHDETAGHPWLVAHRAIAIGDEITFDYGFSLAESLFHPCRCGAPECVGRIIAAPLRPALRRHLRFSRRRD